MGTLKKCTKHSPAAHVFYIPLCSKTLIVFYHSVIQGLGLFICLVIQRLCGERQFKHFFYVLYSDKNMDFLPIRARAGYYLYFKRNIKQKNNTVFSYYYHYHYYNHLLIKWRSCRIKWINDKWSWVSKTSYEWKRYLRLTEPAYILLTHVVS